MLRRRYKKRQCRCLRRFKQIPRSENKVKGRKKMDKRWTHLPQRCIEIEKDTRDTGRKHSKTRVLQGITKVRIS